MGAHILVVEDTPYNLDLMVYLLEAHGHEVTGAISAEAALATLQGMTPDLVVMDLQLPGIDGYQLLALLRANSERRNLPVMAVTAFAMVGDREKALGEGFDGFLTKPIDPEAFGAQIDTHLTAPLRGTTPVSVHEPGVPTAPPSGDGAVVLAVDDWPTNIALVRSVLEPSGFRILAAKSADEALEVARQVRPDLVLCDIHLTTSTGADLLARLRADPELAAIPFAFITGTADRADGIVTGGLAQVIQRPIEPDRFLAAVKALLPAEGPA